jgi:3-deoxy-manno-octulosonate cytidylyltransferase (CMP-KDO synthetase)
MIEHVWSRVRQASSLSGVVVATDDERIRAAVQGFGGEAVLTRADHRSGTERVAEVAVAHKDADIFVNVQGDEPLIAPDAIDEAVQALRDNAAVQVATLAVTIGTPAEIMDPNVVKVVLDFDGNALYFSRAPIPWVRDRGSAVHAATSSIWDFTCTGAGFPISITSQGEGSAEQLSNCDGWRNGYRISVVETEHDSIGVDVRRWRGSSKCLARA